MDDEKGKYSLIDWIGSVIGFVVIGFIVFILLWPLIDPTPNKSSSLKETIHKATGKLVFPNQTEAGFFFGILLLLNSFSQE